MMLTKTNGSFRINDDALLKLAECRRKLGKTQADVAARLGRLVEVWR